MSLGKSIELLAKHAIYSALRPVLRNRPAELPIDAARVRRVLVMRYDAIGDMVVTTPVLELLHRRLPDARIDVVSSRRNHSLLRDDDRVGKRFILGDGIAAMLRLARQARGEGYDVIFSFVLHRTTRGGMLANLIGGPGALKVTLEHPSRRELYATLFNAQIPIPRDRYTMAEMQVRLVCATFGWEFDESMVEIGLRLPPAARRRAEEFLASGSIDRFIALNISSGNPFRRWSMHRNIEFLEALLRREPEMHVVVISAPNEVYEARQIADTAPGRAFAWPAGDDILEVAALLEHAEVVISPDTSIVHLAAAARRPVLVLYSRLASFITEWMPHGVEFEAVVTAMREPLDTIAPQRVLEAYAALRDRTQRIPHARTTPSIDRQ